MAKDAKAEAKSKGYLKLKARRAEDSKRPRESLQSITEDPAEERLN